MMNLEPVQRLSKDLRSAATTLSDEEARFLVDAYYLMQEQRIRTAHQVRDLSKAEEPHEVLHWLSGQSEALENQVKAALTRYIESRGKAAQWALAQVGIGPVITAGLFAHIDIHKAPTVGHIWNFAGLNPGRAWSKGQKRPWNAALKTLCWKIGESFVKVSGNEEAFYGQQYVRRKTLEVERNRTGANAAEAQKALSGKRWGADTEAKIWYTGCLTADAVEKYYETPPERRQGMVKKLAGEPGSGIAMLPPAHVNARAKRWVVKLFLSHLHAVWFEEVNGRAPPPPYAIAVLEHAHYIPVP
jgi:hypothetical protein